MANDTPHREAAPEPAAEPAAITKPVNDPDPAGVGGQEPLETLSWVLIAAGLMLLLPRQWVSAGIAFLVAIGLRMASKRRARANEQPLKRLRRSAG